jgi:hypothetical protein
VNQSQIRYSRERAKAIFERRERQLREAHTVEPKLLTTEQKLKSLKAGQFSVSRTPYGGTYNPSWYQFVVFPDEIKGGLNQPAFDKAKAALDAAYTKLNDELVLGDNELALKLLADFDA